MAEQGIKFSMTINDAQLVAKTQEMAAATGRTVAEQSRLTMKALVKIALTYTPPASQRTPMGKAAQGAGEVAIVRDMKKLFVPVELKHKRAEKWPDPHALHREAFATGKITTPLVRYRVDKAKLTALKTTLQSHVGLLASGWARAAQTLEVPLPAWVSRWAGSDRGTPLQMSQQKNKIFFKVTNHIPTTAEIIALQLIRLVQFAKKAQVNSMTRQIPYILKRNLSKK